MRIKGEKWKIRQKFSLKDEKGDLCFGLCDYNSKTIYLEQDQSRGEMLDTLVHETLHAIIHELEMDLGPLDEPLVRGITKELLRNFTIKPKYLKL